jgi:hypothetical protein
MANEITLTASLTANKPSIMANAVAMSVTGLLRNMAGVNWIENSFVVPITATVVPLGSVTSPRWAWFQNFDPTNFITLFNGVSGAVFLRLLAGDMALCPLDPACVPYAKADTSPCQLSYLILAT